jgi:hypothetical protein
MNLFNASLSSRLSKITWVDVGWVILLATGLLAYFFLDGPEWLFNLLLIPVVLIGYDSYQRLSQPRRKFLIRLLVAVIITYGIRFIWEIYRKVLVPPEWDFHLLWIFGQVSARLLNPYDQSLLIQAAQPLNPSEVFLNELYFFKLLQQCFFIFHWGGLILIPLRFCGMCSIAWF